MALFSTLLDKKTQKSNTAKNLIMRAAEEGDAELTQEDEQLLFAAGITDADFLVAAEVARERIEARNEFDEAEAISQNELPVLRQARDEATDEIEAMRQRHLDEMNEAGEKLQTVSSKLGSVENRVSDQARKAKHRLLETADPAIDEKIKVNRKSIKKIRDVVWQHEEQLRRKKGNLHIAERNEESPGQMISKFTLVEEAKRSLEQTETFIAEKQEEIANLQSEIEKLEVSKLDPINFNSGGEK